MPPETSVTVQGSPNYPQLVQFLVEPFLDSPELLSIDCEQLNNNQRVWVRLAFDNKERGKVFGRGGRNIQAIRTVLETAASSAGQFLYLDIYESQEKSSTRDASGGTPREHRGSDSKDGGSRSSRPKPTFPNRQSEKPENGRSRPTKKQ